MKEDTPEGSLEAEDTPKESGHDAGDPAPEVQDTPEEASGETVPEKRYKDLQGAFTKVSQENAAMREALAELKGNVGALMATRTPQTQEPDELGILDSAELKDEILNNPAEILPVVKKVVQSLGARFAKVLDMRDAAIAEAMRGMDPRRTEMAEALTELRKDDRFSSLPDEVLMAIAEREQKATGSRPRPVSGLNPGRSGAPAKKEDAAEKIKQHPVFKAIYGSGKQEVI